MAESIASELPEEGTIVGEQTDLHLTWLWLWLISWSSAVVDIVGVWLRLLELPGGKS
jgi:hypothetical protein